MKFGVVVFPGSNCDHDMFYSLKTNLNQKVEFLWHKETSLKKCDFIILPGGFSYEIFLRLLKGSKNRWSSKITTQYLV